jgi:hypothetical protein
MYVHRARLAFQTCAAMNSWAELRASNPHFAQNLIGSFDIYQFAGSQKKGSNLSLSDFERLSLPREVEDEGF